MNDASRATEDVARREYVAPELMVYGRIEALTGGVSGALTDATNTGSK